MSVALYPDIVTQKDLTPDHFGSEIDDLVEAIHDATAGWGANKDKVIAALATKDATTRTKIALRYPEIYPNAKCKELTTLMKKEFSGDFSTAMQFLALPPDQAECAMIKKAAAGIGSQANVLFSIICGRTNEEMDLLKKTYFQMYNQDLGKLLAWELRGEMQRLVFNCMQADEQPYDEQYHTPEKAIEDADEIHGMGQGNFWGTDEKGIFKIICSSPPEHLKNVNMAYAEKFGYTLEKAMEKELTGLTEGNVRKAAMHLIGMKLKPYETMAHLIKAACAGFGTDELLLTCCIIRYQGILPAVQTAHIELFQKTIHDRVRHEASGYYKTVLLEVLNVTWPEE